MGALKEIRELTNFQTSQKRYEDLHYFIFGHFMRIKHAYTCLDEVLLYLDEQICLKSSLPLLEPVHKQVFSSIMDDQNI